MDKKGISTIWLIIFGLILIIGSSYWFWIDDIKPWMQGISSDKLVCGPQPPAQCEQNKKLLCNTETKNWECADIKRIDTSDWQTYLNEEYGFEIKYPKDWLPDVDYWQPDELGLLLLHPLVYEDELVIGNNRLVHVPPDIAIAVYQKEQADYIVDHNQYDIKIPNMLVTIAGKPATKYFVNDLEGLDEEIYLPLDTVVIVFGLRNKYNSDVFNQILSTFRFLE